MPFRGQARGRGRVAQTVHDPRSGRGDQASNWRTRAASADADTDAVGAEASRSRSALNEASSASAFTGASILEGAIVMPSPTQLEGPLCPASTDLGLPVQKELACGETCKTVMLPNEQFMPNGTDLDTEVQQKVLPLTTVDTLSQDSIADFVHRVCLKAGSSDSIGSAYATLDYAISFLDFLIEGGTVTTLSEHLDASDVQKVLQELSRSDRFEGRPIAIGLNNPKLDECPRLLLLIPSVHLGSPLNTQTTLRHLCTLKGLLSARPFTKVSKASSRQDIGDKPDVLGNVLHQSHSLATVASAPELGSGSRTVDCQAYGPPLALSLIDVPPPIADWTDCPRGHQMTPSLSSSSTFDSLTEASVTTSPAGGEAVELAEQSDDTIIEGRRHIKVYEGDDEAEGIKLADTHGAHEKPRHEIRKPSPLHRRDSSLSASTQSDRTVTQGSQGGNSEKEPFKRLVHPYLQPAFHHRPFYRNGMLHAMANVIPRCQLELPEPPARIIPKFPPGVSTCTGSSFSRKQCLEFFPVPREMALNKLNPPPCNRHYLLPVGCTNSTCQYAHDYVLTSSQLDRLRFDSKKSPCVALKFNHMCAEGPDNCHMGHVCPYGRSCNYGDRCHFINIPGTHDGEPIAGAEMRAEQAAQERRRPVITYKTGYQEACPSIPTGIAEQPPASVPSTPVQHAVNAQSPPPLVPAFPQALLLQTPPARSAASRSSNEPSHKWSALPIMQLASPEATPVSYMYRPSLSSAMQQPLLYDPPRPKHQQHTAPPRAANGPSQHISPANLPSNFKNGSNFIGPSARRNGGQTRGRSLGSAFKRNFNGQRKTS